jgi:hypothetical protein
MRGILLDHFPNNATAFNRVQIMHARRRSNLLRGHFADCFISNINAHVSEI